MVTEHAEPERRQLDVSKGLPHPVVDVDVEAKLLAVELLGPIDIGHRDDHDLELPVHANLLRWPQMATE